MRSISPSLLSRKDDFTIHNFNNTFFMLLKRLINSKNFSSLNCYVIPRELFNYFRITQSILVSVCQSPQGGRLVYRLSANSHTTFYDFALDTFCAAVPIRWCADYPHREVWHWEWNNLLLDGKSRPFAQIMISLQFPQNIIFRFSVIYRFDYLYYLFSKPSLRLLPLRNYAYFLFIQGEFVPAWKIRTDFKDIRYKHLTHLNVNAKNIDIMRFLAPYFSTTKRKTECSFVKLHSAILMLFVLSFAWLLITW